MKNGLASKVALSGVLAGTAVSQTGCGAILMGAAAGVGYGLVQGDRAQSTESQEYRVDHERYRFFNSRSTPNKSFPARFRNYDGPRGEFEIHPTGIYFIPDSGAMEQAGYFPFSNIKKATSEEGFLFARDELIIYLVDSPAQGFNFDQSLNITSIASEINQKAGSR